MGRLKLVHGYLLYFKHAAIRINPQEPEFSDSPEKACDREGLVCAKVLEMLPAEATEPLGKFMVTISYHDANLYHNVLTGRSVTGVIHLVNKIPVEWHSKK